MTAAPKLPSHPTRPVGYRLILMGGGALGAAGIMLALGGVTVPLMAAAGGGFFVYLGVRTLYEGPAIQVINTSLNLITQGRVDEAEALLDSITPRAQLQRAAHIQRALIAMNRDDPKRACEHATRAIEPRPEILTQSNDRMQQMTARGLRAVGAAALGDATAAREDAAMIRTSPFALPDSLARAALADAILLSRANERAKLAELLARERRLLLEFTTPRDRAVVRALQRMIAAGKRSAYRESARDVEARDAQLAAWIAVVAPEAAAYAPTASPKATTDVPSLADSPPAPRENAPALAALEQRAAPSPRSAQKTLLLWLVLIVVFLGVWQLLGAAEHPARETASGPFPGVTSDVPVGSILVVVFLILFAVLSVFGVLKGRRKLRAQNEARRMLTLPDLGPAEKAWKELARSDTPMAAALAEHELARIAIRRTRFAEALAHCEAGIARIAKSRFATDHLLPQLLTDRAYALAALARSAEATAELEVLRTTCPTYAYAAASQLRVRVVQAVRAGDLTTARTLAAQRAPDMPMALTDETLADLLLATGDAPAAEGELERLHAEIQGDAEVRAWLAAVWPDGSRALEAAARRA